MTGSRKRRQQRDCTCVYVYIVSMMPWPPHTHGGWTTGLGSTTTKHHTKSYRQIKRGLSRRQAAIQQFRDFRHWAGFFIGVGLI
jgi:hypothetical protein